MNTYFIVLSFFVQFSICRDFYVGMFKKNDFLVAQDRLYKERRPFFRYTIAKYGRMFPCPVTFFRVVDRLGIGNGLRVQIIRGGLNKKYLVLQITSSYNLPISANIYVGCSSVKTTTTKQPISSSDEGPVTEDNASPENGREVDKGTTLGKTETSPDDDTTGTNTVTTTATS